MAVVEVHGLRKGYGGRAVVDGVSFEVADVEIFGIVGPNGAGKMLTRIWLIPVRQPAHRNRSLPRGEAPVPQRRDCPSDDRRG